LLTPAEIWDKNSLKLMLDNQKRIGYNMGKQEQKAFVNLKNQKDKK
jgi:hypothetical protein